MAGSDDPVDRRTVPAPVQLRRDRGVPRSYAGRGHGSAASHFDDTEHGSTDEQLAAGPDHRDQPWRFDRRRHDLQTLEPLPSGTDSHLVAHGSERTGRKNNV